MKNVLVLSTSLRKSSNSERLAQSFAEGAKAAGNSVEFLSLSGKSLSFCKGCLACQTTHRCVIRDDAPAIADKMAQADVVVFATPIYYYEMSGQMKTLLDRMNPLYGTDFRFRDIYLLATAADSDEHAMDRAVSGLGGWLDCFPGTQLKGVVRGVGFNDPSEIEGAPILKQAYAMGETV